jgi:Fe-S-cluster containining protein
MPDTKTTVPQAPMPARSRHHLFHQTKWKVLADAETAPASARHSSAAAVAAREMDAAIAYHAEQPFACAKGCSHCCHLHTDITAGEAFVLAAAVSKMPAEQFHNVVTRLLDHIGSQRTTSYRDRFFAPNACALLDLDTNACTVYDVRPTNCRKWHSTDVSRCAERTYRDDPFPLDHAAMTAATVVYQAYGAAMGEDAPRGELHQGLVLALQPNAEARFAAGEAIFADWQTTEDIAVAEEDERKGMAE